MLKKVLIVDMTHGGTKIAKEFSRIGSYKVFGWDIYHTLKDRQKEELHENGVKLIDEEFLKKNQNSLMVVAPVHCKLDYSVDLTHHDAVALLMKNRIDVPVIEVTGVKGKTSVVYMLKEIFKDRNPLILSSLGVEVVENGRSKLLEEDLSITPASIITAWELGQKHHPGIFIVETSLGGTGLADVGILTNVAEDYPIASGSSSASQAKTQIFKNKMVVCDHDSFQKFYREFKDKTNTYSIDGEGNVKAYHIRWGLQETIFGVKVHGLQTISGKVLEDKFEVTTFAPASYHVENVLSAICASLTFGMPVDVIKTGLKNFLGIKGRTSIKTEGRTCIIEEINPGINTTSIKKAIRTIEDLPESVVILGGKYGVTCEEIDEKSASMVLNELNDDIGLIFTDELGSNLKDRTRRNFIYIKDLNQAIDHARKKQYQNIMVIYRSNFPDILHR